jgi:hypothetical protein
MTVQVDRAEVMDRPLGLNQSPVINCLKGLNSPKKASEA